MTACIVSPVREQLVKRLKAIRLRAGFSARELNEKVHHGNCYITRIENGLRFPSIEDLENIAKACNSSLEEIFSEGFETYATDKPFFDMFRKVDQKGKDAMIAFFTAQYAYKEDSIPVNLDANIEKLMVNVS